MTKAEAAESKGPIGRRLLLSRPGLVIVTGLLALAVGYATGSSGRRSAERTAQTMEARLDTAHLELRLHRAGSALATAVVEATYGSFEDARASSGSFFDSLTAIGPQAPAEQEAAFAELLARRDDIQALLIRGESIARDQLADLLTRFHAIVTGRQIRFEIPMGLPETGTRSGSPPGAGEEQGGGMDDGVPDGGTSPDFQPGGA